MNNPARSAVPKLLGSVHFRNQDAARKRRASRVGHGARTAFCRQGCLLARRRAKLTGGRESIVVDYLLLAQKPQRKRRFGKRQTRGGVNLKSAISTSGRENYLERGTWPNVRVQ